MKKIILSIISSLILVSCSMPSTKNGELSGSITAVGSSALLPLTEVSADRFQEQHPNVLINVQGGGSGQGISQVSAGTVEIGNSDIFAQEKKVDLDKYQLMDHKVAVVGIGVIVNFEAKIDNLTQQQLIDIFTGKITNWSQVGGANLPIVVINRASGSGSRSTFEQFGLNNANVMTAQEQDNSGTVKKLVTQAAGAISYVSFSYFDDSLYTAISIDGVKPTSENVANNSWKIWSYEHMYTAKEKDDITRAFIDYILSDEIQNEVVPSLNYIPITAMHVDRDVLGHITKINK